MPDFYSDVIILGAGAAGLAAAHALSQNKVLVCLLEARERIGGRIYTLRSESLPFPIELGAELIHGRCPELWDLAMESGLRMADLNENHWLLESGELKPQPNYYQHIDSVIEPMCKRGDGSTPDESFIHFASRLEQSHPELSGAIEAATKFVENYNAAIPELVSLRFLAKGEISSQRIGTESFRVLDGYDKIAEQLHSKAHSSYRQLHLNTPVTEIKWKPNSVEMSAQQNGKTVTFAAQQAIITVPLGVLKAPAGTPGAISFIPHLDEKQEALRKLQMGRAKRVVMVFDQPFFEYPGTPGTNNEFLEFGFLHCEEAPISTWWSQYPLRAPFLIGWVGGPSATALSINSGELQQSAVQSLSMIFQQPVASIAERVRGFYFHDWNNDPLCRGVYSFYNVGGEESVEILAKPVESTIYFAGEATNTEGFSGTIHGAIRTGYRAAGEVMDSRKI